jgi:hypothetical protein
MASAEVLHKPVALVLCGGLELRIGRIVQGRELPVRQGRLLLAFLALERRRSVAMR